MISRNRTGSIAGRASRACLRSAPGFRLRRAAGRRGFTLIELLVVILIILLVSAVALPVVLPALSHRQVSEAARILQGTLVGSRDAALHNGTPSGIRLLPDPAFPIIYLPNGQIDPTKPFAANRIIPIESAPEYTSGLLTPVVNPALAVLNAVQYPAVNGGGFYPFGVNSVTGTGGRNVLMVKEVVVHNTTMNEPTSWFWNIRVGDRLQIKGSGLWYTVVGPMVVPPQGITINGNFYANSELFVNVGPAGSQSPLTDLQGTPGVQVFPEFLFLVNGLDDNKNGWIDEGYDGVDNNLAFEVANNAPHVIDELGEWEVEAWPTTIVANPPANVEYTIQRRPAPTATAREVSLPTNVVIDMTMLLGSLPSPTGGAQPWSFSERSQFPSGVINPYTGYVDILLNPNGTVVPTTIYSAPSSFGMSSAFFHFWLAERSDVVGVTLDPNNNNPVPLVNNQQVFLPIGNIQQQLVIPTSPYAPHPALKGEYRIVTLFTRTGQITTSDDVQFDNPMKPVPNSYNPLYPFLSAEQGSKGSR